jgi:phospholipid-translocating P-type ATPase (flippase)
MGDSSEPLINQAAASSGYGTKAEQPLEDTKRILSFPFKNEGPNGERLYPNNKVVTAKYNVATFLPLNLAEQFSKVANVYFAIQSLLTFFPQISPYEWYSVVFAFFFVVSMSMAKDAYADHQRHKDDNETNHRKCRVMRNGVWHDDMSWQDVEVGDGIEIKDGETVPADMLILSTQLRSGFSQQDNVFNTAGICYVNTADMDGETNLKVFEGRAETNHLNDFPGTQSTKLEDFFCEENTIEVDEPNTRLYQVEGSLTLAKQCTLEASNAAPLKMDLDKHNVLLRQTKVENTHRVWGVVIYTGPETKIAMNNAQVKDRKSSSMDKMLNRMLILVFVVLLVLCFGCAIGCGTWNDAYAEESWYIGLEDRFDGSFDTNWYGTDDSAAIGTMSFFTFFILFANLVPISLYVTVEFVKFFTGYLVDWDENMYHEPIDKGAKCRDANIAEQAGQVEYILSDKTGTLTQNRMDFLKCIIGGVRYGQVECEVEARLKGEGNTPLSRSDFPEVEGEDPTAVFYDVRLNDGNWHKQSDPEDNAWMTVSKDDLKDTAETPAKRQRFLQALSLCHSVFPLEKEGVITLSAESPDDKALVEFAKLMGCELIKREKVGDGFLLTISELQADKTKTEAQYSVLHLIEFSSKRKRMSVIVQTPEDKVNGECTIIMKGADSFVAKLLTNPQDPESMHTQTIVDEYARYGLRTLFVASGKTSLENVNKFLAEWSKAKRSKDSALQEKLKDAMETGVYNPGGLQLIGATAIEDKLQDEVALTLRSFRDAQIRTWVLTGDKVETAVEIGKACELLTQDMQQVYVRESIKDPVTGKSRQLECQELIDTLFWQLRIRMGDAFSLYFRKRKQEITQQQQEDDGASVMSGGAVLREVDKAELCWNEWLPRGHEDKHPDQTINVSDSEREELETKAKDGGGATPVALVVEGGALMTLGMGQGDEWYVPDAYKWTFKNPAKASEKQKKEMEIARQQKLDKYHRWQRQFIMCAGSLQPNIELADGSIRSPDVKTVLCCRVTPKQKGQVTCAVKKVLQRTTLGVGDGANDVDMIKEADLGVGVQGVEGSQAVNNSDFAITQFKHLRNLLYVHGRWTYRRLGKAVCYFFYKNIIPTTTIFLYTLLTGFSGAPMYNAMILSTYNLFFTSLPVIAFALLEQDVDYDNSMQHPPLYTAGSRNAYLNQGLFVRWCAEAFLASCFLFVVPWYSTAANPDGKIYSFEACSLAMFTFILFAVTYRLALETQYWTWLNVLTYAGSLILWFLYIMVECGLKYGIVTLGVMYWEIFNLMGDSVFWLNLLLAPFAAVLPAFVYKIMKELYWPTDSLKVRHEWRRSVEEDMENKKKRDMLSQTLPDVGDDHGEDSEAARGDERTATERINQRLSGHWFTNASSDDNNN